MHRFLSIAAISAALVLTGCTAAGPGSGADSTPPAGAPSAAPSETPSQTPSPATTQAGNEDELRAALVEQCGELSRDSFQNAANVTFAPASEAVVEPREDGYVYVYVEATSPGATDPEGSAAECVIDAVTGEALVYGARTRGTPDPEMSIGTA